MENEKTFNQLEKDFSTISLLMNGLGSSTYSRDDSFNFCREAYEFASKHSNNFFKEIEKNSKYNFYLGYIYFIHAKSEIVRMGIYQENLLNIEFVHQISIDKEKLNKCRDILFKSHEFFDRAHESNSHSNWAAPDLINITHSKVLCELGSSFIIVNDFVNAVKYYDMAQEKGSISAMSMLVYLFGNEDVLNLDKASFYFCKIREFRFKEDDKKNWPQQIGNKMMAYNYIFNAVFDHNLFEKAREIIAYFKDDCKSYLLYYPAFSEMFDETIEKWTKQCDDKLEEINNEKKTNQYLIDYFTKETLDLMTDNIKIFIFTSTSIYDTLINDKNVTYDYSAVVMPIMKAIECILFQIFAVKYLKFLKNKKTLDFGEIDSLFLDYNRKTDTMELKNSVDKFDFGTAINLAMRRYHRSPRPYFIEFLADNKIEDPIVTTDEFCQKLQEIQRQRNKAAHRFRIMQSDADECFDILLKNIKFIQYIYTHFFPLFN